MMNSFLPINFKVGKVDNFQKNITKIDSSNRQSKQFQPFKKLNCNQTYACHHPSKDTCTE